MRFLPIVWRNLLRRKFRTFFTMGAIFFAFLLFGVLMAIRSAFSMGIDMAGQGRLMVIDKVSIINPLPASYEQQIKQVGDIGQIMMWIVAMAMFTILLVTGNTMAQAIRERTNELAVLKTLGFPDGDGAVVLIVPDKKVPDGGKLF